MGRSQLLNGFKELLESKSDVQKNNPWSPVGRKWFAKGSALFRQLDSMRAAEFTRIAHMLQVPLSSYTAGPLWHQALLMIGEATEELELSVSDVEHKTYGPDGAYSFYKDLKKIIGEAQKSVFIADRYMNEDIFDLYLEKVSTGVNIRLLIGPPSNAFRKVINKFHQKTGAELEVKQSKGFHDRVIFIDDKICWILGQSIKDAATEKPTYLAPINDVDSIKPHYEDVWSKATAV